MLIQPFRIAVDEAVLTDLRQRIRATRWPDQIPGADWRQGTELGFLRRLLTYWVDGFDWRAQERELNRYRHFRADLDGVWIHFVHQRADRGSGIPLILTHGWPSTFLEMLPLVERLTAPRGGPGFDVVVPSLPGYGFSERPARTGVNYRYVARLWHELMHGLGYHRYGAHGSDFGSGVATVMALDRPEPMLGVHLTNLDIAPYSGPGVRPLSKAEDAYLRHNQTWWQAEGGYKAIQSTKPQTLGYGLHDSPAGLAAWIVEKWRSWSDSGGDLDRRFSRDFLLSTLTVYWATGTITSSMRDYYDNRHCPVDIGPGDFVTVPTGIAVFGHEYLPEGEPPREWAERLYNVRRWTVMPRGGHFPAVEEPDLVVRDITEFFTGPAVH
ncbi:MAG TPA: epoxide hydrolase [Micromonosporaceae bacterium]|nr:epoxide hydrolase [Micromonosporaceae bacterium]